jgi:pyruvate kinase
MSQQKTSLTRTLRVGDEFSVDNGRIVVRLESQSGKRARLTFKMDPQIKVDKSLPTQGAGVLTETQVNTHDDRDEHAAPR